jgi:hypothetical protein
VRRHTSGLPVPFNQKIGPPNEPQPGKNRFIKSTENKQRKSRDQRPFQCRDQNTAFLVIFESTEHSLGTRNAGAQFKAGWRSERDFPDWQQIDVVVSTALYRVLIAFHLCIPNDRLIAHHAHRCRANCPQQRQRHRNSKDDSVRSWPDHQPLSHALDRSATAGGGHAQGWAALPTNPASSSTPTGGEHRNPW